MAPPGTRVVVHEKPENRGTWAPHGVDAWYIGPAMEHYRCYTTYVWSTQAERVSDTVEWFPHEVKMPTASTLELLLAATKDILKCLEQPTHNSPLHPLTDSEQESLKTLTNIFQNNLPTQQNQNTDPTTHPTPVLRVDDTTPVDTTPTLRVEATTPIIPAQSLRVEPTTPAVEAASPSNNPVTPHPTSQRIHPVNGQSPNVVQKLNLQPNWTKAHH